MILRVTLTLIIDHDPDLITGRVPDTAPAVAPRAVAERPLRKQLLWPWAEDYPDDPPR